MNKKSVNTVRFPPWATNIDTNINVKNFHVFCIQERKNFETICSAIEDIQVRTYENLGFSSVKLCEIHSHSFHHWQTTRWFRNEYETNQQPIRFNFDVEFFRSILPYNQILCLHF